MKGQALSVKLPGLLENLSWANATGKHAQPAPQRRRGRATPAGNFRQPLHLQRALGAWAACDPSSSQPAKTPIGPHTGDSETSALEKRPDSPLARLLQPCEQAGTLATSPASASKSSRPAPTRSPHVCQRVVSRQVPLLTVTGAGVAIGTLARRQGAHWEAGSPLGTQNQEQGSCRGGDPCLSACPSRGAAENRRAVMVRPPS